MNLNQGDIIKIDGISTPVFVASTKVFNRAEMIIGCPIVNTGESNALHYNLEHSDQKGLVLCEQLKFLDLRKRHYSYMSAANIIDSMEIVDIIQGIFDYSVGMQN